MKKLGILFITIGIIIISYVSFNYFKYNIEKNKLIKQINSATFDVPKEDKTDDKQDEAKTDSTNKDIEVKSAIVPVGILNIPKLNLEVPIIEGTIDLRYAVGHIIGTGDIGKDNQNYCIAGHRNYLVGDFFRHLDKVQENDTFTIKVKNNVLKYRVFKTEIVTPDKVEIMNPIKGKSVVTLITCHPEYSTQYRLVVYGEKIQ